MLVIIQIAAHVPQGSGSLTISAYPVMIFVITVLPQDVSVVLIMLEMIPQTADVP
jgi:hypothetical protein